MADTKSGIERAGELVGDAERLVVFTGAGVSTESGIPDFRSPGGIWDRYDPSDFTIDAFRRDPVAYWERSLEREAESDFSWEEVEPNPAHEAIARLERDGPLSAVVTQNVDGLHQAAGNDPDRVLELHGTRKEAKCLDCARRFPISVLETKLDEEPLPPRCDECDGLVKRATIAFGERLPQEVLRRAEQESRACDCFVIVGSSVTVQPAASLPRIAVQYGADLIVVNLQETPMDDDADVVLAEKAGEALPRIVDAALS